MFHMNVHKQRQEILKKFHYGPNKLEKTDVIKRVKTRNDLHNFRVEG
jgi:hypothetical protein